MECLSTASMERRRCKKLTVIMCMTKIICNAKIRRLRWKKMNGSLLYVKITWRKYLNIEEKTRWSGQPFRTSLSCVYCCSLSLNLSSSLSLSLVSISLSLSFCLCWFISPVHYFGGEHYTVLYLVSTCLPLSLSLCGVYYLRAHYCGTSASASLYYLYAPF